MISEAESDIHIALSSVGPATESALGLRPRRALPSAQYRRSVSQTQELCALAGAKKDKYAIDEGQRFHIWRTPLACSRGSQPRVRIIISI
jgi:hypothetical protein